MIHPAVISGSPKGIAVYVYGAGTADANGTYVEQGSYNDRLKYVSQDGLRMLWYYGDYKYYYISDLDDYDILNAYYYDKSAADNPWDGTQWLRASEGISPIPTVSLTSQPPPTAMRFDGAGSDPGQPLDVPVIGVYNGKPEYYLEASGSNYQIRARWTDEFGPTGGFAWVIAIGELSRLNYWSSEDVDYSDQVVTWNVGPNGEPPSPTITAVY